MSSRTVRYKGRLSHKQLAVRKGDADSHPNIKQCDADCRRDSRANLRHRRIVKISVWRTRRSRRAPARSLPNGAGRRRALGAAAAAVRGRRLGRHVPRAAPGLHAGRRQRSRTNPCGPGSRCTSRPRRSASIARRPDLPPIVGRECLLVPGKSYQRVVQRQRGAYTQAHCEDRCRHSDCPARERHRCDRDD
jgi:hypothetical protein